MVAIDVDAETAFERAVARGRMMGLLYRGAVTPVEAYVLAQAGKARIVDVRSRFEHEYVGRIPNTPLIEWKRLDTGAENPDFLASLAKLGSVDDCFLFLCRSGVRSHAAALAATAAGYKGAFNILEGFEGDLDENQRRGTKGGWRHAGLPWIQS